MQVNASLTVNKKGKTFDTEKHKSAKSTVPSNMHKSSLHVNNQDKMKVLKVKFGSCRVLYIAFVHVLSSKCSD